MKTVIKKSDLPDIFRAVGVIMSDNAELLCEMDAQMGDGDLGLTMKKGFSALPEIIDTIDEPDIGKLLSKSGMKMASVAPSTMGTLMASGIMAGAKALSGLQDIDAKAFADYLTGFADGVAKRGKCAPGDRTLLDAILPASERAQDAAGRGASLSEVSTCALEGALLGLEATKDMIPKFGKAAVFASKSKGNPDQGAFAGMLMIKAYHEWIIG